jgi:hypothetical protein
VFREPRVESGFPDLVIVVWREHITAEWRPEWVSLEARDLRVMHFLHQARRATKSALLGFFGRRSLESVERLQDAAMIRLVGSSWTPCAFRRSFAALKIIAVEAKIGKWVDVLNQAHVDTWFASKSYVLVPNPPSEPQLVAAQQKPSGACWRFGISEAENERLWFAEAERRQRETQSGLVEALPGEEVLRRVAADIS